MCLGPELAMIAGMAASGAGTYLQSKEQQANDKRIQNAKNAAFTGEMNRQRQYADEAGAQFNRNIEKQGSEPFNQQKQIEADRMKQAFIERRTQPDYNVGLTSNAPKNVVIGRQAASDTANEKTNRDLENLSGLSGYQGALFNQGLDQNEFARLFGNVQDKAGGQARIFPVRMNAAANNANRTPSLFPTLLKAGGQALSIGAAGGAFSPETIFWNGGGSTTLASPFQSMLSRVV